MGTPAVGDAVTDPWGMPKLVGHYGQNGEDGNGIETIWAQYSQTILPAAAYPDNAWTFDMPQVSATVQWFDEIPELTDSAPFLFVASRRGSRISRAWHGTGLRGVGRLVDAAAHWLAEHRWPGL